MLEEEGRTARLEGDDFAFCDSFDVEAVGGGVAGFVPESDERTPQPTPRAERAACPCEAIPMYFSAVFCRTFRSAVRTAE